MAQPREVERDLYTEVFRDFVCREQKIENIRVKELLNFDTAGFFSSKATVAVLMSKLNLGTLNDIEQIGREMVR